MTVVFTRLWALVDWRLSKREILGWMCPLKREQATRVSYNTLTHSCTDSEKK